MFKKTKKKKIREKAVYELTLRPLKPPSFTRVPSAAAAATSTASSVTSKTLVPPPLVLVTDWKAK
jgi:hypothetical protein